MLFDTEKKKHWSGRAGAVALLVASLMCATAIASKGLVQDRRVTLEQARAMAVKAKGASALPVEVNELVLAQLNRYIGTPEGRQYMRDSLTRMESYRSTVQSALERYDVPFEIMAIPIVESGYRNLGEERNSKARGAGLWQFIPSTARRFGMVVNENRDDRLDVPVETDAAMRYLSANQLRFQDWRLAILSYNMGENAVSDAIVETGIRDPWELIRRGYENDQAYLARVVAAILIMRNPDSIK